MTILINFIFVPREQFVSEKTKSLKMDFFWTKMANKLIYFEHFFYFYINN